MGKELDDNAQIHFQTCADVDVYFGRDWCEVESQGEPYLGMTESRALEPSNRAEGRVGT